VARLIVAVQTMGHRLRQVLLTGKRENGEVSDGTARQMWQASGGSRTRGKAEAARLSTLLQ
jgi:hypothetical protein